MEQMIRIALLVACLMFAVANYPDAKYGLAQLYIDIIGE